jgi:hypothetical protein
MATVASPVAHTRSSRRSTQPAAPKLRDSCDACAVSKVKCNKEKPTCARCAKRGMVCEYFITKRAGRKHDPRPSEQTTPTTIPQTSSSTSSDAGNLITPDIIQSFPSQQAISYQDLSPNALSPADPSWWMLTTLGTEMDDIFASPFSFSPPEPSDSDTIGGQSLFFSTGGTGSSQSDFDPNDSSIVIPEDGFVIMDDIPEPTKHSKQASLPENQSPLPSDALKEDALTFSGFRPGSSCCCLLRALGLLKLLFRNAATACKCSKKQGYDHTDCQRPTIQSVIAENEQTIEAITSMLQCPCSQDGYLLAIMSLIVFKILAWYAAAAKETPDPSGPDQSQNLDRYQAPSRRPSSCHAEQVLHFPTVVGSYCLEGEDQGRMAAQLVLSELHRVQRLVNELSQRLKAADGQDSIRDGDGDITYPFSATMLNQLEVDLRKRLRALSLEIVDTLRRG